MSPEERMHEIAVAIAAHLIMDLAVEVTRENRNGNMARASRLAGDWLAAFADYLEAHEPPHDIEIAAAQAAVLGHLGPLLGCIMALGESQ